MGLRTYQHPGKLKEEKVTDIIGEEQARIKTGRRTLEKPRTIWNEEKNYKRLVGKNLSVTVSFLSTKFFIY